MEKEINVHTLKYYRVILEAIDRSVETPETFAVKMTLRLRMTTPRAKSVVRHLPCVLRSNLSAPEANRLKVVLEEFGGICRLETHFVTPGEGREPEPLLDMRRDATKQDATITCPACGYEEEGDATYCSMCLRRFRDPSQRDGGLGARIPHDNPLDGSTFRPADHAASVVQSLWQRHKWLIVAGAGLLVLLVLIIK